ncbi:MAG TPA: hypothetical protein VK188_10550 [Holophaga sp.]|nr:hypothetical protein [Holophaga sp.]
MDYTWPSVYFAYLFFALMFALAAFFFVKTARDGYWGKDGEEPKYRMLEDDAERRPHE